jgi:hypothetical protein
MLLLPLAAWSQGPASGTGHFAQALSWGANKQTFDARFGIRHVEATFSVATNGFGWLQTFTGSKETFRAWSDVTAWCSGPGTVLVRTRSSPPHFDVYDLKPEDLVTIVDGYFKKYVPELQWSSPGWECTQANLSRPNPADLSKVRELLEAASTEKP